MTTMEYGTTLVRATNPAIEYIDITPFGARFPVYLEKWRGWRIELWSDWEWSE